MEKCSCLSERIAYPEVETKGVKEGRDVKITGNRLREIGLAVLQHLLDPEFFDK